MFSWYGKYQAVVPTFGTLPKTIHKYKLATQLSIRKYKFHLMNAASTVFQFQCLWIPHSPWRRIFIVRRLRYRILRGHSIQCNEYVTYSRPVFTSSAIVNIMSKRTHGRASNDELRGNTSEKKQTEETECCFAIIRDGKNRGEINFWKKKYLFEIGQNWCRIEFFD